MSFVRTLVLIAIAVALGAWIYLVEEPNAEKEAKAAFLVDFDPAAVERVKLVYPKGDPIELERDHAAWKLTSPVHYPADASVVENFLTTVKETKIERRLAKGEAGTLATYGLDTPTGSQARVELTLAGNKSLPAIVLGIATPVGYQAFARREGDDDVLVIPLLLQSSAVKTPFDLRSKSMFEPVDDAAIKHVTIEKPGEKIELERRGDAAWAMLSPVADSADTESVRSMLDSIATIDALAFFDGPAVDRKAFGLEDDSVRFRASGAGGAGNDGSKGVSFRIGKASEDQPAGSYFERDSDHQVIKAPDWVLTKFAPAATELRDKRLLSCRLDEVRSLKFTFGGDSYTLSREAAGKPWSIDPVVPDQVVNQRIVDNALNALVLARADQVAGDLATGGNPAAYGLDAPLARLEVTGAAGPCALLSAAKAPTEPAPEGSKLAPQSKYYIKDDRRSAVLLASQHEYSRLAMKRSEFVDAAAKGDAAPATKAASDDATP